MNKNLLWLVTFLLLVFDHPVEAQQPKKMPRIGFLALPAATSPLEEAFLQGLRDLGYIEGQNIIIDYRRAAGKVNRPPRWPKNWSG
ncbi:MAG: hypothetical protein ACREQ2_09490 [Candidatus Binatia bacterium]